MKERNFLDFENKDNGLEQTIIFNTTKNDLFKINDNLKILHRKLKSIYKVNM